MLADTTRTRDRTPVRIAFGPFNAPDKPLSERPKTMKIDVETFVCSVRGHVTPAGSVGVVGPEDAALAIDVHPTWRISRCLRCDVWVGGPPPATPERERLPGWEELALPRRGKELRSAVLLRFIAIERGIHAFVFTAIAVLAVLLRSHLAGVQSSVRRYLQTLANTESQTGRTSSHGIVTTEGTKLLHLKSSTLEVLIITAALYAVVEGAEAVGLWYEKRWAEYLTAIATAGFVPIEIHELLKKVTVVRVGALVINTAILIYLVFAKHLFGLGTRAQKAEAAAEGHRAPFSRPF
jgi:uncharacterized membrane protein (DUF2068 family)